MSWYGTGTVNLVTGSQVVKGVGVDWLPNVQVGHGIVLPDGRTYEVFGFTDTTTMTIKPPYKGATADGQGYAILPTQGFAQSAATKLTDFLSQIGQWVTGALAGRFGDGSAAAPGISFAADQDTGLARAGENAVSLVAGGNVALTAVGSNVQMGATSFIGTVPRLGVRGVVSQWAAQVEGVTAADGSYGLRVIAGTSASDFAFSVLNAAGTVPYLQVKGNGDTYCPSGNFGIGTITPQSALHIARSVGAQLTTVQQWTNTSDQDRGGYVKIGGQVQFGTNSGVYPLSFAIDSVERARLDTAGNLLVGVATGTYHTIYGAKAPDADNIVCSIGSTQSGASLIAYAVSGGAFGSGARAAVKVNRDAQTGRSINAGGTINGSGADYAEYMTKAAACGTIAKGDVVGIDRDGLVTDRWADAISFMLKSTDPSLVGGDTWGAHQPKPEEPIFVAPAYEGPAAPLPAIPAPTPLADLPPAPVKPIREEGESEDDYVMRLVAFVQENSAYIAAASSLPERLEQWRAADRTAADDAIRFAGEKAVYDQAQATYRADVEAAEAAHDAAMQTYATDLAAWEVAHEAARQKVDRIAYCGQVPVNMSGPVGVGDYLVAVQDGDAIGLVAVADGAVTFDQYRRRVGRVLAIRDGRPWVDVQHG